MWVNCTTSAECSKSKYLAMSLVTDNLSEVKGVLLEDLLIIFLKLKFDG
jgi:hypothetical protein